MNIPPIGLSDKFSTSNYPHIETFFSDSSYMRLWRKMAEWRRCSELIQKGERSYWNIIKNFQDEIIELVADNEEYARGSRHPDIWIISIDDIIRQPKASLYALN